MTRLNISPEKKQECIAYALAQPEINLKQLSADLGIGHSTLSKWVRQARVKGVGFYEMTFRSIFMLPGIYG